ncbi:unnamed protein product [Cochlearia groenlandica]
MCTSPKDPWICVIRFSVAVKRLVVSSKLASDDFSAFRSEGIMKVVCLQCSCGRMIMKVLLLVFLLRKVGPEEEEMAQYCLTSTIMLSLTTDDESSGKFGLYGSIRRQMKMELAVADDHLCNMGRMIEELDGKLKNSLDQVDKVPTRSAFKDVVDW